jgi:hypothetical protein
MKLHPLPTPQQYRSWRNNTRSEIAAASNKPEACFRWVLEAEAPTATYDLLADSGEFGTLDIKLAAALTKVATGEIGRKVTLAVETEAKPGRMLKGRQIYCGWSMTTTSTMRKSGLCTITRTCCPGVSKTIRVWNHS